MPRSKIIKLRADIETAELCPQIAAWRNKRSVSAWLDEFIQSERVAYEFALQRGFAGNRSRRRRAA